MTKHAPDYAARMDDAIHLAQDVDAFARVLYEAALRERERWGEKSHDAPAYEDLDVREGALFRALARRVQTLLVVPVVLATRGPQIGQIAVRRVATRRTSSTR